MMTNDDIVQGCLAEDWCIAGGFAACPQLATDCDVWVLGTTEYTAERDRTAILAVLRAKVGPDKFVEEDEDGPDVPYCGSISSWKVARLSDGRHIILTTAMAAEELIENFDVSTHACAITSDGRFVKGRQWTSLDDEPVKIRSNPKSAERMKKIRDRYAGFSGNLRVGGGASNDTQGIAEGGKTPSRGGAS